VVCTIKPAPGFKTTIILSKSGVFDASFEVKILILPETYAK